MFIHAECDYHGKKGVSSKCIRIPMRSIVSCKLADALACAEIWKPRCSLLLCDAKRMTEVEHERAELRKSEKSAKPKKNRVACLSITDKHDALSRSLNCFASYQKRDVVCVSEEEKLYRLEFYYDWRVDSGCRYTAIITAMQLFTAGTTCIFRCARHYRNFLFLK